MAHSLMPKMSHGVREGTRRRWDKERRNGFRLGRWGRPHARTRHSSGARKVGLQEGPAGTEAHQQGPTKDTERTENPPCLGGRKTRTCPGD